MRKREKKELCCVIQKGWCTKCDNHKCKSHYLKKFKDTKDFFFRSIWSVIRILFTWKWPYILWRWFKKEHSYGLSARTCTDHFGLINKILRFNFVCSFFFLSEEIILVLMSEKLLLFYINFRCLINRVYITWFIMNNKECIRTHDVLYVVIKMIHKEIVLSVEVISCWVNPSKSHYKHHDLCITESGNRWIQLKILELVYIVSGQIELYDKHMASSSKYVYIVKSVSFVVRFYHHKWCLNLFCVIKKNFFYGAWVNCR